MLKPESAFIASIHKKLKVRTDKLTILKMNLRFNSGWPDSIYIGKNGRLVWVEYKIWPNTLTKLQEYVIKDLREKQQIVLVITKHPNHVTVDNGITETIMNPVDWFNQYFD